MLQETLDLQVPQETPGQQVLQEHLEQLDLLVLLELVVPLVQQVPQAPQDLKVVQEPQARLGHQELVVVQVPRDLLVPPVRREPQV